MSDLKKKKQKYIFTDPYTYKEFLDGFKNYDEVVIDTAYLPFEEKLVVKVELLNIGVDED